LGNPEWAFFKTVGLVLGLPALIYLIACTAAGHGCMPSSD